MKIDSSSSSEGEWSLVSSSRSINHGRSERGSIRIVRNYNGDTDKKDAADFVGHVRSDYQTPENEIGHNSNNSMEGSNMHQPQLQQLAALKEFLFDSFENSQKAFHSVGGFSLSVFENSFDLTEDRLRRIFNNLDKNQNGNISYEELRLGLKYHSSELGTRPVSDRVLIGLTRYLDANKSGEITFEEFSEGIRLMLLRNLINDVRTSDKNEDSVVTEIFDYNSISLKQYLLKGDSQVKHPIINFEACSKSLVDFFLEERGAEVAVRWINITGKKASNIMKMVALKYRLHPLALEDALECTNHRPKADSYDGHYFIMVPVFQLNKDINSDKKPGIEQHIKITWYNKIFDAQKHGTVKNNEDFVTDTETLTDDDADGSSQNKFIHVHMTSIFITKPQGRTVVTFNNENSDESSWCRLHSELKKEYSKLRQYDGQHLAYRILDEAEDKLGEIVNQLKIVVRNEIKSVANTDYRDLARIHSLKQQMHSMSRKFKPFVRLLKHVIEDDSFSPGASIYLRDVLDNLEIHDEDLKSLIAKCDSVGEDAEKFQAKQMENTLYILTVISAVFLPAQFLTGVYGMNFEFMPELAQPHAYKVFWAVSITAAVVTTFFIKMR